ncbi:isochorismatase family protein [Cellulomonas sp. 179-A 4D5 NHS]|uniref:isochorismatase family protein n=1 Tax=Cellulomonas sp. 179-A 4D5 NHS TaxID=3142378 RepID=UPI0039A08FDA
MTTALIVVDVEVCFAEGGTLPVAGGAAVAAAVTAHLAAHPQRYARVVASRDWHDPLPATNDGHFAVPGTEPDYVRTWPEHGVAGTPDAEYHPGLRLPAGTVHVVKGMGRADYSAFDGVQLDSLGTDRPLGVLDALDGVDVVEVVGIATDHCVRATALAAAEAGFAVRVLTDLTAGVAVPTTIAALTDLAQAGVELTTSSAVAS